MKRRMGQNWSFSIDTMFFIRIVILPIAMTGFTYRSDGPCLSNWRFLSYRLLFCPSIVAFTVNFHIYRSIKKHRLIDVMYRSIDTKGPSIDTKGPSIDTKSPSIDAKGPSIDMKSPSFDVKILQSVHDVMHGNVLLDWKIRDKAISLLTNLFPLAQSEHKPSEALVCSQTPCRVTRLIQVTPCDTAGQIADV